MAVAVAVAGQCVRLAACLGPQSPCPHPLRPQFCFQVLWKQGLVVTFVTIAGAVLAWLLGLYALHCWHARCFNLLDDAATACQWVARSGLASFSSEGSQHGQARPLGTSNGKSSQMGSRTSSKVSLPATASLGTGIAGSNSGAEEPDLEEALAAAARQLKREQLARRVNAWRLESLGKRGHGMVHTLVNCLQVGWGSPSGLCLCCLMGQAIPCLPRQARTCMP